MKPWKQALVDSIWLGAITGAATSLAAALCGKMELDNPIAPINAISHIVYGDEAAQADDLSLKYTLTGLALNDVAHGSWAVLYELFFGEAAEQGNVTVSLLGGAGIAGFAYILDYHIVPRRLTPGLEKRLSSRSLFIIYVVFALCLGVGGLLRKRSR